MYWSGGRHIDPDIATLRERTRRQLQSSHRLLDLASWLQSDQHRYYLHQACNASQSVIMKGAVLRMIQNPALLLWYSRQLAVNQ